MPQMQTRRRVMAGLAATGTLNLSAPRLLAAPPALETTTIRFGKIAVLCFVPQYVCEELLRAEGFTDIRYLDADVQDLPLHLGRGEFDFATSVTPQHIAAIDIGTPITLVGGVHAGCYELLAHDGIRTVRDLKGKRIGTTAATDLIEMMAAYVGLEPKKDLTIVSDIAANPLEQFVEGKLDAYMGLPPEPQILHARGFRQAIVRTAVGPPWSQYFCCSLAANRDFVRKHPTATKRVLRAMLKAADLCASEPERVARFLVSAGFTEHHDYALQTLNENPYGHWRDYDAEDSVRFYALRQHELSLIKKTPQRIIAEGTDWRFLNELKRELKA
jgi:NitT/TauT family transport system substrate-binding protein